MKIKKISEIMCAVLAGTWIVEYLMNYFGAYLLFIALMLIDYISGVLASYKEAIEHPKDSNYGWSSKKGIIGIYKKVGYMLTNIVALCLDYMLHDLSETFGIKVSSNTWVALVVLVWFILNELLSITENAARLGAPIPNLLVKVLSELKDDVDNKNL